MLADRICVPRALFGSTLLALFSMASETVALAAPVQTLIPTSDSIWSTSGLSEYEEMGTSVSSAGDVNGDGFDDVIVGAPGWGPGASFRGRALVFLGSPRGLLTTPSYAVEGAQENSTLGYSVAGAGDVNGDGYDDVIVGEYGFSGPHPQSGRALIVPGSPSGGHAIRTWEFLGSSEQELFGEDVAAAGDVNGDGYDDVLVGGQVSTRLIFGRQGRADDRNAWVGPRSYRARGVGDVNRDGYDDIALAGGLETLVYFGSPSGLSTVPSWRGPTALSVSGGDVNGDGFSDVLLGPEKVGAPIRLFLGSALGPSSIPIWQFGDTGHFFGLSLAANGDVNRDGFDDILVTSPRHMEGNTIKPAILVFLGGSTTPSSRPDWEGLFPHDSPLDCALGADVDGDGASEVLAGDPYTLSNRGQARLFRLGSGYPVPAIIHEPVLTAPVDSPISLRATVTDYTHRVARVEILYRTVEDLDYRAPIPMGSVGENLYEGAIPAVGLAYLNPVYQIRAFDDYGLIGQTEPVGIEILDANVSTRGTGFEVHYEAPTPGHGGSVTFNTRREGPCRMRIYDVQGRLIGSVLDTSALGRGQHSIGVPATPSGVFFYVLETVEGVRKGRFVQLR